MSFPREPARPVPMQKPLVGAGASVCVSSVCVCVCSGIEVDLGMDLHFGKSDTRRYDREADCRISRKDNL